MVKNSEIIYIYFLKKWWNGEKGDLNLNFLHKYFICSLEYISMIVYTNGENHLFSSLVIIYQSP